jgi:hypothetical protein
MRAPWIVTLVCGASGTGKSYLARPLAERYGAPLAEADDIVTALQAITTPEQQPVLHFWQTHPQFRSWAPERIAARHFEVADALRPAYAAVIAAPGSAPWSVRSWPGGLDAAACRSSLPGHGATASIASTRPCARPESAAIPTEAP